MERSIPKTSGNRQNKIEKQIKELKQIVKATVQSGEYNNKTSKIKVKQKRPTQIRSKYGPLAADYYTLVRKQANLAFLSSILNPYETAIERLPCAIPSAIPVPTTSVHYLQKATCTIAATGALYLIWTMPKALEEQRGSGYGQRTIVESSDGNILGSFYGVGQAGSTVASNEMLIPIMNANKVRLVSAELRVTYTGKVVDQSGTIESAVSFTDGVLQNGYNTTISPVYPFVPDWSNLQQAPWYKYEPVSTNTVHTCIWVPTDYNDMNFYSPRESSATTASNCEVHDVQWNIAMKGLSPGSSITLEIASNWEVQLRPQNDIYARHQVVPNIDVKTANELRLAVASRSDPLVATASEALLPTAVRTPQQGSNSISNALKSAANAAFTSYLGPELGSAVGALTAHALQSTSASDKQIDFYRLNSMLN